MPHHKCSGLSLLNQSLVLVFLISDRSKLIFSCRIQVLLARTRSLTFHKVRCQSRLSDRAQCKNDSLSVGGASCPGWCGHQ
jgi:hypothetical protein